MWSYFAFLAKISNTSCRRVPRGNGFCSVNRGTSRSGSVKHLDKLCHARDGPLHPSPPGRAPFARFRRSCRWTSAPASGNSSTAPFGCRCATVTRFLAQLTVHGHGEVFAGLHQARGQADHPAVQRIAELADEHQVAVARWARHRIRCRRRARRWRRPPLQLRQRLRRRSLPAPSSMAAMAVLLRASRRASSARYASRPLREAASYMYVAAVGAARDVRMYFLIESLPVRPCSSTLQLRGFAHGGFLPVD